MKSITIGMPSGDMIYADTAFSLVQAITYTQSLADLRIVCIVNEKTAMIQKSRCSMVETARKHNSDYIFFVDSDMRFPHYTIERLLAADKEVVACACSTRRLPPRSNVSGLDGKRINGIRTGLEEVARIGTGVMLVKMSVFDELVQPYFNIYLDPKIGWVGEDFDFCDKVRAIGKKIYCDHDLSQEIFHLGMASFNIGDVKLDQE